MLVVKKRKIDLAPAFRLTILVLFCLLCFLRFGGQNVSSISLVSLAVAFLLPTVALFMPVIRGLDSSPVEVDYSAALLANSPDAIISLLSEDRIGSWNKGAERLFGYAAAEMIGESIEPLILAINSHDLFLSVQNHIANYGFWETESDCVRRDGSVFVGSISCNAIPAKDGSMCGIGLIIRDFSVHKKRQDELIRLNEGVLIDARRRSDEAKRMELHFRALLENSNDVIVLLNETGKVIYRSPSAFRITGWNNDELARMSILEHIIHPDEREGVRKILQDLRLHPGRQIEFNYRGLHKKGHYIHVEATITNLLHIEYIQGIVLNFRDVSKNEEAREKLAASERLFRTLIENISDSIVMSDPYFNILYQSPSVEKILGYCPEERIGKSLLNFVHPAHLQAFSDFYKSLLLSAGKPLPFQYQFRHKNGNYIWLEGVVTNFLDNPEVRAYVANYRDISDRKRSEEQLHRSEEHYRMLVEQSADGIFLFNSEGRITDVNPAGCRMFQYSRAELLNLAVDDILAEGELQRLPGEIRRFENGSATRTEWQLKQSDGSVFIGEVTGRSLPDGGYQAILRDITERKKAFQEIKKSNERFEIVTRATNDIIWDWNIESNELWWNQNYYSHFGFSRGATEQNVKLWQHGVHPDDLQSVLDSTRKSLADRNETCVIEYRFKKADNEYAFVRDCGYILYDNAKNPYRMVGSITDISESRQMERKLKQDFLEQESAANRLSAILNTLSANIAFLDSTGTVLEVNRAWKKFADENGYQGENYNVGENYLQICSETKGKEREDSLIVREGIENVLANKIDHFIFEYPCHSPNMKRWFRMTVTPLRTKADSGAVVMHVDISELRRLEQKRLDEKIKEQRRIAQLMLNAQEKERTAIGAELHDNVNQILVGTNLFLSIANRKPEKTQEYIKYAIDNIKNAIEENRRIAHELVTPDFEGISLPELLRNLCDNMLKKAGIEVEIIDAGLKANCLDRQKQLAVYRIAQEQCTNILKHAEANSATLLLSSTPEFFYMTISDNGKGMSKHKASGGIGLKNIINRLEAFNGTAKMHSKLGKGFSIEVSIPL